MFQVKSVIRFNPSPNPYSFLVDTYLFSAFISQQIVICQVSEVNDSRNQTDEMVIFLW